MVIDAGKIVGTKGENLVKIVVAWPQPNGNIYPIKH